MAEIILANGKVCLVDDADFELVSAYSWYEKQHHNTSYAMYTGWRGKPQFRMHRFILGVERGVLIDHKNHNGLDNRRENLRTCTTSQNNANRLPTPGRFKGIWRRKDRRCWIAKICCLGKEYVIRGFKTPEDAAKAYDEMAVRLYGEFACLNFPKS